jgi:hypothetical protein
MGSLSSVTHNPADELRAMARELEADLALVEAQISATAARMLDVEGRAIAAVKRHDDRSARELLIEQAASAGELEQLDADAKVLRALLDEIREFFAEQGIASGHQ